MSLSCYSGGERVTLIWTTFYSEWIFVYLMKIWLRKYYYTSIIIVSVLRNQAVELSRGEKRGGNSINYAEGKPPKAGMWRNKVNKFMPSAVELLFVCVCVAWIMHMTLMSRLQIDHSDITAEASHACTFTHMCLACLYRLIKYYYHMSV